MVSMTLDELSSLTGHGTSMISLTIAPSPKALTNSIKLMAGEYKTAGNIKCRV